MENNISKRETNKAYKKALILDAAEKLFTQKGFDNTSIDDVGKAAKVTKRTLYHFFNSKEDLFYAVALKGAKQLAFDYENAFDQGENALKKIRNGNNVYLQFYKDFLGMFRILNYHPANLQNCASSPHFREMEILNATRMKHLANLVAEGKSDGSINSNLDTKKAVFFAFYSAFSLLFTVSSTDKSVWDMLELDENEFLQFSFDLLANALE